MTKTDKYGILHLVDKIAGVAQLVEHLTRNEKVTCSSHATSSKKDTVNIGNGGGHGMMFKTFTNEYKFIYHSPNIPTYERPVISSIELFDLKENYTINKTK